MNSSYYISWCKVFGLLAVLGFSSLGLAAAAAEQRKSPPVEEVQSAKIEEESLHQTPSILSRSLSAGAVVFLVLLILMIMSVLTWSVVAIKWFSLSKIERHSSAFIQNFWDSRSLNELNTRLGDHPYSPIREVFRSGYAELVRGNQLKEISSLEVAVGAAMDNLNRTLNKAKIQEKRFLERWLSLLAISASASPFIGLFGTVWGIMNAFEGIALSGNANLAAVAPGISEALIATAFGLAAAIPAVIGYNFAANKIRGITYQIDGFGADFLNIVERYLISDRSKQHAGPGHDSSISTSGI